jgi:hypothetical protein
MRQATASVGCKDIPYLQDIRAGADEQQLIADKQQQKRQAKSRCGDTCIG